MVLEICSSIDRHMLIATVTSCRQLNVDVGEQHHTVECRELVSRRTDGDTDGLDDGVDERGDVVH